MDESPFPLTRRSFLLFSSLFATYPGALFAKTEDRPLCIGIIGANNIGPTMGGMWANAGYEVMFSASAGESRGDLLSLLGPSVDIGSTAETIDFGDILFLDLPYKDYVRFGEQYSDQLKDKPVIDAGNVYLRRDGDIYIEAKINGIGVTTAKYLPGAHIVRAFCSGGFRLYKNNANRPEPRMAVPIAGDDMKAVRLTEKMAEALGFAPVFVGPLPSADSFAAETSVYGIALTAQEIRTKLGLSSEERLPD